MRRLASGAPSTCCSSGSLRINRARSFSVQPSRRRRRVLPCYTTAAAGRLAGVGRGTPIAPRPTSRPLVRSTGRVEGDGRPSGARCGWDRVLARAWRPWFWPLMRPEWKAARCRQPSTPVISTAFDAASVSDRLNLRLLLLAGTPWVAATIGPLIHAESLIIAWVWL